MIGPQMIGTKLRALVDMPDWWLKQGDTITKIENEQVMLYEKDAEPGVFISMDDVEESDNFEVVP